MSAGRDLLMKPPGTKPAEPSEDVLITEQHRERNKLAAELVQMFRGAMSEAVRKMIEEVRQMPQVPHRKPSGWSVKVNRKDGLIDTLDITPKD